MNVDERLLDIAKNCSALAPLALELREKGISPEWFAAYRKLPVTRRKVLLRAFLGQPYLISTPDEQYGSARSYLRLLDAVCARSPELVDTPLYRWVLPKDAIPGPVAAVFGHSGSFSAPRFLRDLLFRTTIRPARAIRRHRHYKALVRQCRFGRETARDYFLSDISHSKGFARYFRSEVEEVWAPNTIHYLYFFLDYFLRGEIDRPQQKIPLCVSGLLGIPCLSIPDLLAIIDVLHLGARGALDMDDLRVANRNLAVLVDYLARPAFRPMRRAFSVIGNLTRERARALYKRRRNRARRSAFETSFLFNMDSLFQGNKLRSKGVYRFVRTEPFRQQTLEHFSRHAPDMEERVRRLYAYRPDLENSLDLRSFVNILIYLDTLIDDRLLETEPGGGLDYMAALPSVAKFQFGVSRPVRVHDSRRKEKKRSRKTAVRKQKPTRYARYRKENRVIENLVG